MPSDGEATTDPEQAVIAAIATALRDMFGERAMTVARSQAEAAEGQAREAWSAIVERLAAG